MNINEFRITYVLPTYLCKVKRRNNIDQSNDEPINPETPRNKDLKYDREKRTRTFQNLWIDKIPWLLGSSLTRMLRKCTASTVENFHTCQIGKMPLLGELKIYALMDLSYTINTRSTWSVKSPLGLVLYWLCYLNMPTINKTYLILLCVKHWFKELDGP